TNELTLELWYKDTGLGNPYGLIAKRGPFPQGGHYGINVYPNGAGIQVYFQDPNYPSYQVSAYQPVPQTGVFHQLGATYKQVSAEQIETKTYVDGQLVKTSTLPGNFGRTVNSTPVTIGSSSAEGEFMVGIVDEPSIYGRALSDSEILGIFNAGSGGKCAVPFPPFIVTQPANQIVTVGGTATFSIAAGGSQPLSYQWVFNGSN